MYKLLALAFLLLTITYFTQAQTHQRCATTEYTKHIDEQYFQNNYKNKRAALETYTQQWIAQHGNQKQMGEILTIPVVVHVVHTTSNPASNISEAQINSQIEVLNEDFRRLNADAVQTPAAFLPVAADFEVEFCIAHKDPDGYPTTGITRTATTETIFNVNTNNVKSVTTGGANAWPSNRYLNIWVCNDLENNDGDPILGYAQFPAGGPPQFDGIVVAYFSFGRVGAVTPPYNKGRTATHEVGHWLNLIHTWGDKDLPMGVDPSCETDDLVNDTPRTIEPHFGCSLTLNSCSNETPDLNDMIQNYMDYASESCQNIFTLGQKQRIRAILEPGGVRNNLVAQPDLCSVGENDVSALKVISPAGTGGCTTFEPVVELVNSGSSTLYYVEINYSVDNGPVNNTYWVGELLPYQWINITLPVMNTILPGIIHTFTVSFSSPNGVNDFNLNDNEFVQSFATVSKGANLPFVADLETGTFPAANWQVINEDNSITFALYDGAGFSGNRSVYMANVNYNATGTIDEFNMAPVDLNEVNPKLEFYQAYAQKTAGDISDTLEVLVSTNCGQSFTSAYKISGTELITALSPTASSFVPTAINWRRHVVSLWDFRGTRSAVIKFRQIRGTGNNLFIDDMHVYAGDVGIEPDAADPNIELMVFPNPVYHTANLRIKTNPLTKPEVSVFNTTGQLVYHNSGELQTEGTLQLPVENWQPGIYYIHFNNGKETITRKLVVAH